jgi:hypothetical protein
MQALQEFVRGTNFHCVPNAMLSLLDHFPPISLVNLTIHPKRSGDKTECATRDLEVDWIYLLATAVVATKGIIDMWYIYCSADVDREGPRRQLHLTN